jgi:hypothetical protein
MSHFQHVAKEGVGKAGTTCVTSHGVVKMRQIETRLRRVRLATLILVLASMCLAACHPEPSPAAAAQPSKSDLAQSRTGVPVVKGMTEGMAYADMRALVLADGWVPVADKKCNYNVVGAGFKPLCAEHPDLGSCSICSNLPELSACSGDAYCGMYFSKDGKRLHVVSYGDIRDWNVHGDRSQLTVSGWDAAVEPAPR